MKDDLVLTLRTWKGKALTHVVLGRAADEIERLRAEVDLKGSRLDDALDEIEQLQKVRIHWQQTATLATKHADEEIERLQAAGDALAACFINRLEPFTDDERVIIEGWQEARRG